MTSSSQQFQRPSDVWIILSKPHELLPSLSFHCLFWPQLVVLGEPSGSVSNITGHHWCEVILVSTEDASGLLYAVVSFMETDMWIMLSEIVGRLPSSQTLVHQHRRDTVKDFWNQVTDQSIYNIPFQPAYLHERRAWCLLKYACCHGQKLDSLWISVKNHI